MNNLDKKYTDLLQDILDNGTRKMDRTGTGTLSVFGRQIRHKMSEGFPLLTTKKMPFRLIATELLWFLRGDTNIKYLVDNDCHIWDGDAFKNYIKNNPNSDEQMVNDASKMVNIKDWFINKIKTDAEFAKQWGELGPVYGKQWRSWETTNVRCRKFEEIYNMSDDSIVVEKSTIDQIANLIRDLKTNPDSRRLMVNVWNVGELDQMVLPPCHYGFQVYTRELSASERITYKNTKQINLLDSNELFDFIKSNVSIDLDNEVHKECDKFNIPTRAISLMWNQRSVDTFLGLPFNIASYGLLLEIIAKLVNMVPDELIGNLGDTHLYLNHVEQAKEQIGRELSLYERIDWWFKNNKPNRNVLEEIESSPSNVQEKYFDGAGVPKRTREPYPLPSLDIHPGILDYDMEKYPIGLFEIKDYQSHPAIKAPLSN